MRKRNAGLHHDLPVTDLTPGPLTLEETLHVLGALTPGHAMAASSLDRFADIGQWLFRETRGQPFYDEELVALASVQLSRQLILQGRYGSIERLLPPAIPILEHKANWPDWTHALGFLGIARAGRGQYTAGVALGQRALERAPRRG